MFRIVPLTSRLPFRARLRVELHAERDLVLDRGCVLLHCQLRVVIADEQWRMRTAQRFTVVVGSAMKPADQLPGSWWQPWLPFPGWQVSSVWLSEADPLADELAFADALWSSSLVRRWVPDSPCPCVVDCRHAARSHAALFCALAQDFGAGSVDPPLHAEGPRATAIAMASPQLSRVQLICRAQMLFLLVVRVMGEALAGRERLEEAQLDGSIALWFCAACRQ